MSSKEDFKNVKDTDSGDFYSYLKEAQHTDLSEVERTGCVSSGKDLKSNPVIVLIPVLGTSAGEKVEVSFRKMLLLFIKKANDLVDTNYSVVYAHTNVDIINQYPLIYKFYSVLPRAYKKNLQKMYVIHPNMGIKMFFEFARVFLSHKFYSKLVLLDSILEFQKLIPPTQLCLPLKFLRKEDELRGLKFFDKMASLKYSFDPAIGTTKLIHICATFLRLHGALQSKGIFRVAGDAGEVNLAKVRLQYANLNGDYTDRIMLAENQASILIGDVSHLQKVRPITLDRKISGDLHLKTKPTVDNAAMLSEEEALPEEVPMSIVVIHDINTVGQIFKMSIGNLAESLVPYEVYCEMIEATRRHEAIGFNHAWEHKLATALSHMEHSHLSTLVYIVQFLREVCACSAVNAMDSSNLAIIFAPTIFRPDMIDPMKAVMEMKHSKTILKELIDRLSVLQQAMHLFTDRRRSAGLDETLFIFENPINAAYETALDEELATKMNIADVRSITDNFSSRLTNRMNLTPRSGAGRAARVATPEPEPEMEENFEEPLPESPTSFYPPAPGEIKVNLRETFGFEEEESGK